MGGRRIPKEKVEEFVTLRARGLTFTDIAERFPPHSRQVVRNAVARYLDRMPPPGEMEWLRYHWDQEFAAMIDADPVKKAEWLEVTRTIREETESVLPYRLDILTAPGVPLHRIDLSEAGEPSPQAVHRLVLE